jgi:16S rRNA (adenine1518-N6/adenine1519-N6)-dimethyltransferase
MMKENTDSHVCVRNRGESVVSLTGAPVRVNVPKAVAASGKREHKPKLGQHFLADDSAALRIIEALGDISQKTVLEIGPGRGVITSPLARRARRLIAIELDRVLAAQLRMKFALYPNVEIIEGDVLAIDLATLFGPKPGASRPGLVQAPEPVRVVGNLPYYITSDILLRLFSFRQCFDSIVIMVQKEVADRLSASPGSREYGLLTATAQLYARVEKLFTLPPSAFAPPPKVHSSVVRLTMAPKLESLGVPEEPFIQFLKLSFGQKRKTLWNNLKTEYPGDSLRAALREAGVQPAMRAEALPLETNAAIFRALAARNGDGSPPTK